MTKKYDFISYYHVLEHIQWPEKELEKAKSVLKDGGYLYISVPTWLDILDESAGTPCLDFENLYHINHINVFTEASFENLLRNAQLDIVMINKTYYCYTVLCKVNKSIKPNIVKEKYADIFDKITTNKKAIDALNAKEYDHAIQLWPKYPDAHIMKTMSKDLMKDFEGQRKVLEDALALMPEYYKLTSHIAKLYFQWDEQLPGNKFYSNNIKKAEKYLEIHEKNKPFSGEYY